MTGMAHSPQSSAALRLREGRAPVRERLIAMLCLIALLHAIVILGVSFTGGLGSGQQETPQLDVLLVTNQVPEARSNEQAVYLAQRTQHGAGDTSARVPPGSPASRGALERLLDEQRGADERGSHNPVRTPKAERVLATTALTPEVRYLGFEPAPDQSQAAQAELLGDTPGAPRSGRGDAVELLLRGKQNGEQWISPDTRASKLAPYLAEWKRKVERVGTLNFPSAARKAGLSGSPVVEVEIAADGRLRQARVRRTSGYGALDQAALTILKLASPFNPFPPDIAAEYSRLRFAYQWDFVSGTLQAAAPPDTSSDTSPNASPNTSPDTSPDTHADTLTAVPADTPAAGADSPAGTAAPPTSASAGANSRTP
jgi:periplasmic protein TonB